MLLCRALLRRRGGVFFSVRVIECGVAGEAACVTGFRHGFSLADQRGCKKQPLFLNIAADRVTGLLFEQMHEIGAVQGHLMGDPVYGEGIILQMVVDVFDGPADDGVGRCLLHGDRILAFQASCEEQEELCQAASSQKISAGACISYREDEIPGKTLEQLGSPRAGTDQVRAALAAGGKAPEQIRVLIPEGVKKARGNVHDDPLVEGIIMDDGAVDLPGADRNDVPGLQIVASPLDNITDVAGDKDEQLVKVMIVERNLPCLAVRIVEDAEILPQISGFLKLILCVLLFSHMYALLLLPFYCPFVFLLPLSFAAFFCCPSAVFLARGRPEMILIIERPGITWFHYAIYI